MAKIKETTPLETAQEELPHSEIGWTGDGGGLAQPSPRSHKHHERRVAPDCRPSLGPLFP